MASDEQCQRWCIGLPRPYGPEDAAHFIAAAAQLWHTSGAARFAVADAASGELLASVALRPLAGGTVGEIGYMAAPQARGRGVTSAALRLLSVWAFDQLRLTRLEALIQAGNQASIRTAKRAGFTSTGLHRGCRSCG